MGAPPRLFDPRLRPLREPRRRRLAAARAGADFLLARALDDLPDRLGSVNRPFPVAVDLFSPTSRVAQALARPDRFVARVASVWDAGGEDGGASAVASAETLPLGPASVDLAVSLLALQWCEDLPGALLQICQALRPDGLFLGCLVGGRTLHELRAAFARAETEVEGGVSPHVIPFADLRDLGALLQRAGFALPVTDADTVVVRYDTMFELMADLRAMGATNALAERSKRFARRDTMLRAASVYAEQFSDADGRIRATFELVWLSGWAPHESQQKPLKPGSAKASLAEALGTREVRLRDDPA